MRYIFLLLFLPSLALAAPDEQCFYITPTGKIVQLKSGEEAPKQFKSHVKCLTTNSSTRLAKPEEIDLEGNIRREVLSSSLGKINLRWPRKVELLFGRTPSRAMTDAARTVSRVLHGAGFPARVQNLNNEWQVVFMDETLPESQIPQQLITNCHPGWMTPPANIYIVGQRVAAGCSGEKSVKSAVADSQLARVLIHEIGHAVEFQLLKGTGGGDRMRAEGFATWFERYASGRSSVIEGKEVDAQLQAYAKESRRESPSAFQFQGTAFDYARASMYFSAIENRRGVGGIMDVYEKMANERLDFFSAVEKVVGWKRDKLEEESQKILLRR